MSLYRLQPTTDRRWWGTLFGVTAVILLLPAALLLVVPTRAVSEQVELGMPEYDWTVPLDIRCRPSTDAMLQGWQCGQVLVQTVVAKGGTDPDRTLRRMMRAMNYTPAPEDAEVLREGETRMIIDDYTDSVGISQEGAAQQEGLTMVAVLTGPGTELAPLADTVWQEFTGRPLPEIVQEAIVTPDSGTNGDFRIPLELSQVVAS